MSRLSLAAVHESLVALFGHSGGSALSPLTNVERRKRFSQSLDVSAQARRVGDQPRSHVGILTPRPLLSGAAWAAFSMPPSCSGI
jgi:hypothetical protein